ncbi:response regulator transcription factor [Cellulosilyticum sp. I15G10I2]|uniref:response regulator transcription factor n=1 Tax=Cellulosilyticum sp. I15G10I2 TaxID=1892843 RepID=UPI00085BF004|nr:response regulator [Cellulosilyticum sp. I15G10I2]
MKIGIVEDEYFEREAIKLLISRSEIPAEVIYEIDNGADAVLLFRKHRPDLIFIDIEMPVLSGLDAAKKIREIDQNVEIVILTAYNEFAYAQQAIKINVMDYLLKPYNSEKLYEIIRRVDEKLVAKNKDSINENAKKKKMLEIDKYLKKEILYYMISGRFFDKWSYELYNDFFSIGKKVLRCVLYRISKNLLIEEHQIQAIQMEMERAFPGIVCSVLERDIVGIRVEERSERYKNYEIPEGVVSLLPGVNVQDVQMSSESTEDINGLPFVYQRLKEKVNTVEIEQGLKSKKVMEIYILENNLYEQILGGDREKTHQIIMDLSRMVNSTNKGELIKNKAYFSYLWRGIDRYIFQITGRRKSTIEKNAIDFRLEKAETMDELVGIIEQFILLYSKEFEADGGNVVSRVVEQAKEYIKTNLDKELSLENIAEALGYSSFHFSKTFKKVEGVNFKEYVIKVRMEKAKLLFIQGGNNVSEVSKMVGYHNTNYFSKVFHKYFGILPKDFKK